jgi:hypothetical protein
MDAVVAVVAAPGTFVFLSALMTPWVRRRVPQHRDACALAFFFAVQIAILSVAVEERWLGVLILAVAVESVILAAWFFPTRGSRWRAFEREFRTWAAARQRDTSRS